MYIFIIANGLKKCKGFVIIGVIEFTCKIKGTYENK